MLPFDRSLCLRTLVWVLVAFGLTLGVVIGTDEAFSTPAMRVARLSAFAPAIAALGVWLAVAQSRSRGETRALEALGASPWRVCRGAIVGGWLVGALAVAMLLSPWADGEALFPVLSATTSWSLDGATLVEPNIGARAHATGELELFQAEGARPLGFESAPRAAVLAVAPMAVLSPPWAGARVPPWLRMASLGVALAMSVVMLHAVASGQVSPWLLPVSAAPLALVVGATRLRMEMA